MLPPPGHGKPTVSAGVRRLGSCRSRTTTLTKVASSSATGPEPPLSLAPSDSATLESPAESIGITSDDESSGTNALFISKPATTISRSSRSPSSAKSAKGGSLAEILASSTAGHKRPLKLVSRAPSADALSSLRPATESKRRKTPVDKTQLPPPPPSRLSSDESDDLSLLSSWPSDCSGVGGESGVECLLEVDDEKNQASGNYSDSLSESLVGAGSLRVDMRIDLSEGTGASESGLSAPVAADEALPTDVRVAMDEPLAEEAVPLSDMPQPVPALKPAPTPKSKAAAKTVALMVATEVAIAKRTDKGKGKGKAVDYQPPPQSTTSKRECSLSDGQVLTESHFGPLDLGLKPIRVSANRSLMRRKPRKSDDAN
ncbi:hypothetical protein IWW47_002191 [Coemansia sp. RSA 2052]|nr:hypothetical protein IWW47_002191 [Coemansia sp. RSA 2052]